MRISMVLTLYAEREISGEKTGFWLEAFAAPYYIFEAVGNLITGQNPSSAEVGAKAVLAQL